MTASTASVRLSTPSARRIAETWFLTVGSARPRARQMSLLFLPCISSASTSSWRPVRPRSAGVGALLSVAVAVAVAVAAAKAPAVLGVTVVAKGCTANGGT